VVCLRRTLSSSRVAKLEEACAKEKETLVTGCHSLECVMN
jgi:hypothetical protein